MKVLAAILGFLLGGAVSTVGWFFACFLLASLGAQSSGDPTGAGGYVVLFMVTSPVVFIICGVISCVAVVSMSGKT